MMAKVRRRAISWVEFIEKQKGESQKQAGITREGHGLPGDAAEPAEGYSRAGTTARRPRLLRTARAD
jgi:hypothetical protein